MKAITYISKFKKENGTDDIMKCFMSDDGLLHGNSVASIVCSIPRTTQQILNHEPLRFVVYIYREQLDDINVLHYDDLKEACDYAKRVLD